MMNKKYFKEVSRGHPREMFITSYHHFRRVMCSTKYTVAQKDDAFDGLTEDYFRCDLTDSDKKIFVATVEEWVIRKGWEEFRVRP